MGCFSTDFFVHAFAAASSSCASFFLYASPQSHIASMIGRGLMNVRMVKKSSADIPTDDTVSDYGNDFLLYVEMGRFHVSAAVY